MHHSITRFAGAAALVVTLGLGTTAAFAANGSGATASPEAQSAGVDSPDALPAGAIPLLVAQQDALRNYPGGTAVADGTNDQNGTITYGFTVTQNGTAHDVQVDALTGAVVQADAAGTDADTGADAGAPEAGGANG